MKKVAGQVMFLGRAMVFAVGLAVILAVVLGLASSALAANGKPFLLGKFNVATKVSTLVNKGVGPALGLKVGADQAPLTVNPEAGTATNLSADELDGKDAGAFLGRSEKAASAATADDANTLDGVDSAAFARTTSEQWRAVGASGQPAFGTGLQSTPMWQNADSSHNSAGFYKDSTGTVHLKGLVKFINNTGNTGTVRLACNTNNAVFTLPQGYRPAVREVLLSVSNDVPIRVNVDSNGGIYTCNQTRDWAGGEWVSLDGLSFRASN
jgi:hypothetical protein